MQIEKHMDHNSPNLCGTMIHKPEGVEDSTKVASRGPETEFLELSTLTLNDESAKEPQMLTQKSKNEDKASKSNVNKGIARPTITSSLKECPIGDEAEKDEPQMLTQESKNEDEENKANINKRIARPTITSSMCLTSDEATKEPQMPTQESKNEDKVDKSNINQGIARPTITSSLKDFPTSDESAKEPRMSTQESENEGEEDKKASIARPTITSSLCPTSDESAKGPQMLTQEYKNEDEDDKSNINKRIARPTITSSLCPISDESAKEPQMLTPGSKIEDEDDKANINKSIAQPTVTPPKESPTCPRSTTVIFIGLIGAISISLPYLLYLMMNRLEANKTLMLFETKFGCFSIRTIASLQNCEDDININEWYE